MTVELISVGTEILMGNIVNSNTQFLAEKCAMLGFDLFFQVTVGDNYDRMMSVVRQGLSRSDILILTGGLGPTEDDLTKEVCADAFGMPLVEDAHTREHLKEFFRNNIYSHIPDNNWKMATVPQGALVLDNANGMAPGLILEKEGKTAILLPGPPNELYPMFSGQVFPYLQQKQNAVLVSSMVKICGYGESQVEDTLKAYGAVSEETAREMAEGGVNTSGTDLCVATTGIAGPDGGTDEKPVGLVYMACCLRGKTCVRRYQFKGNREKVREQAMMKALDLARLCILANN